MPTPGGYQVRRHHHRDALGRRHHQSPHDGHDRRHRHGRRGAHAPRLLHLNPHARHARRHHPGPLEARPGLPGHHPPPPSRLPCSSRRHLPPSRRLGHRPRPARSPRRRLHSHRRSLEQRSTQRCERAVEHAGVCVCAGTSWCECVARARPFNVHMPLPDSTRLAAPPAPPPQEARPRLTSAAACCCRRCWRPAICSTRRSAGGLL